MNDLYFDVLGVTPVSDPAARDWLARSHQLALAYSREVHGDRPDCHFQDALTVHLAASSLWKSTGGAPCWGAFDAAAWEREMQTIPHWEEMAEPAAVTLYAFFCFLAKHGHLSKERALAAQERLLPRVRPLFERLRDSIVPPGGAALLN